MRNDNCDSLLNKSKKKNNKEGEEANVTKGAIRKQWEPTKIQETMQETISNRMQNEPITGKRGQ